MSRRGGGIAGIEMFDRDFKGTSRPEDANIALCRPDGFLYPQSSAVFDALKGAESLSISRRGFVKAVLAALAFPTFFSGAEALEIKGVEYVSIPQVAKMMGMRWKTIVAKKRQNIYSAYSQLSFDVHQRDMVLNGNKIWLGFPVALSGSTLYMALSDYYKNLRPILFPSTSGTVPSSYTVVIDAGHGGKDNGAQNKRLGLIEKNATLDLAKRVGAILKARGHRVLYTRTKDVFLELEDRSKYANANRGSIFLSLHFNAAGASAAGVETFALTPSGQPSTSSVGASVSDKKSYFGNAYDPWNVLLAYYIQTQIRQKTGAQDRGIKRARFVVLKGVKMPAVLVEGGFITNSYEGRKLMSSKYRQSLAEGIAAGVTKYASTLYRYRKK